MRELKPDLAQALTPGGPVLTGREAGELWRHAPSQRVRDLAWCSLSPPLLSHLPAEYGGEPFGLASWPAGARSAWQGWLAAADPATLPETIAELSHHPDASRSLRLGRHAERLLHFALSHTEGLELLASNVPVRHALPHGIRTLGELDVVWRDPASGQTVHWEMAAKFYLHVGHPRAPAGNRRAFVGPNLVDRLGDKLDHILRRQLPLGRTPQARAALGREIDRGEVYLLGWLFYRDGVLPPGLDALGIAPDHLRGWWSTLEDWVVRARRQSATRWCRLPRAGWLSGARVAVDGVAADGVAADGAAVTSAEPASTETASTETATGGTEDVEALHAALAQRFADPHQAHRWRRESPVMLCELEPGPGPGSAWQERSRGFVVPPGWEARARERAGLV